MVRQQAKRAERLTVVFDLDGTLVDTAPDLRGALNTVLVEQGVPPVPLEETLHLVGHGALAMIRGGIARSRDPEDFDAARLFDRFLDVYRSRLTRESRPYPGVPETLRELAGRGHPLAVCTNKTEDLARRLLAGLGLDWFGEAVVGADTFAWRKPDPRALEAAVARAGGAPERSALIGDSRTDVETARNAGVPSILVGYGYRSEPIEALEADFVVHEFKEIEGIIQNISSSSDAFRE